ncbi:MAG: sensor domain-containing diguanylate cyclase [Eubacterium sp.]|nr:sensor domain-containing diguanylate cyclase [Eubacterium sp.]
MDFQSFTDNVGMPCCVISVEKKGDTYGDIRILCSNKAYKDVMGPAYYDNMLYYELVPQDNKFEDYCYKSAVLGKWMHAYVETKALGGWTDQTLIPLESDREDMGYCEYIFEFTKEAEMDRASMVSRDVSNVVLKIGMTIIRGDSFRESLGKVIDIIKAFSGAKGCRAIFIDHERQQVVNYGERMEGSAWKEGDEDIISYDLVREWEKLIGVSDAVIVKDERDMEIIEAADPEWAESLRVNGVKSVVLVPLHRERAVVGYIYVVNFDVEKVAEVKESLQMASYILGTEIANHQLVRKLDEISSIDELTGLGNRRSMHRKMDAIRENESKTPFGIVNIDLNGLKVVNDHYGHAAGDRMLIQAGEILRKVFYQEDLFRTGGDEFVVIISDIEKDAFSRKMRMLRNDMEKNSDVSFAIGECWSEGTMDLTDAFRCADEKMYADKDAYYADNPDKKRRK